MFIIPPGGYEKVISQLVDLKKDLYKYRNGNAETGKEEFKIKPTTEKQKISALKELAARRLEAQQREEERRRSGNGKKGVEEER